MTADLRSEFIADKDANRITVQREFAAGRQLVWDCHTRSEYLDRWFAPKPLTTRTKHMDFREGGYWHYAMIMPDGQEFWSRIDYRTINPIDDYTARDGFSDPSGEINQDMPRSDWHVTFSDAGEHTLVTTVVQYASADDLQKVIDMGMKDGIQSTMDRLDELLVQLKQG
jgi:uncharacterized protein YndB with AHSA1/START domain